jgi:hypothetical protein
VLFRLIFNILSTDSSTGPIQEDVAWGSDLFPEQNCALKRIFSDKDSNQRRPTIPTSWARAREYRDGEDRFTAIARHYRSLAKIEQSITDQRPNKRADKPRFAPGGTRDHLTGTYRREAMRVMRQRESPSGLRSICDRQRSNP